MFNRHITDFNENIIGLRDFIDLIEPFLNEKAEEHNKQISPLITLGILNEIGSKKKEWEEGEKEKYDSFKQELNEKILEVYKKKVDVEIETNIEDDEEDKTERNKTLSIKFRATDAPELINHLHSVRKVSDHIELLYKNSFISLLSTVEWFFSQILHFNYDKFPESAGIQKKTMTLSDLKTFGTIEDAEKFLIDQFLK
jgi:hypothetical protein